MRLKIQHKVSLIIITIVTLILSGIYIYLKTNLQQHTYQRIRQNLSRSALLAKSYLEAKLVKDIKNQNFDLIADQIGSHLDVRVTIINPEGIVIGDSELTKLELGNVENHLYRPEIQKALLEGVGDSRRFSTTLKTEMLYFAYRIKHQQWVGVIRLAIPLSDIAIISNHLNKMLLYSLVLAFLFAITVGFFGSIFVARPIKEITSVAKEIANQNYDKKIVISTHDEFEELGNAFNHMSKQIKLKINEVIANKSRFEAIFLNMFEGVMVIDESGRILLMNGALKKLMDIQGDFIGKPPIEVIRNIDIQEIVDQTMQMQAQVISKEISTVQPAETVLQVHATSIVQNGKVNGAVLVFHDITELRRLEIVRRDFVANVSHELRTPITNIKGFAETLLDGAIEDKEHAKEFLQIISSDSDRLANLVEDLLDLSKIESGKLDLDIKPHKIDDLINTVVRGLEQRVKKKNIVIEVDISKEIPRINCDEASISQVLLNLIDNAIKYNKDKGFVKIFAKQNDSFVFITVQDSGIGIPEKDLPRIFERFYRVDKARSRDLGGTGLGLAIAKHIVQSNAGELSIQSQLDIGTTVTFSLPIAS